MRTFPGTPIKAFFELLDEIHERLAAHHEFPSTDESAESFSSIVSRSVVTPVKTLTAQVEAQQRAIQSLKMCFLRRRASRPSCSRRSRRVVPQLTYTSPLPMAARVWPRSRNAERSGRRWFYVRSRYFGGTGPR
jgi:hypothetical protein